MELALLRSIAIGATIEIADITVGDIVNAHDPETGQSGPREVLATWPHTDTLVEFEVGDATVTTTEDHEFWNVTDQAWQETCLLYTSPSPRDRQKSRMPSSA